MQCLPSMLLFSGRQMLTKKGFPALYERYLACLLAACVQANLKTTKHSCFTRMLTCLIPCSLCEARAQKGCSACRAQGKASSEGA